MKGKVKIIDSGFFSTIQDEGRFGYSKFGVPTSGAMDQVSYNFANSLLGNDKDDACLEWVFKPPVLQFSEATHISLTGADTDCFLNGNKVKMYHQISVQKGDILTMDFCKKKKYGYVGVKKGFLVPVVMNSRSFFKSITSQFILQNNDEIEYHRNEYLNNQFSNLSIYTTQEKTNHLLVFEGPEYYLLSEKQKDTLKNTHFTISGMANRMAIQLEEKIPNKLSSMLTSPVLPGTVQLTPAGSIIVLMRDCQTTGGYPRILQLSEESINAIAQKRTGDMAKLQLVTL